MKNLDDFLVGILFNRALIKVDILNWDIYERIKNRIYPYKLMPIVFMVREDTGCWQCLTGSVNRQAYPSVSLNKKMRRVSRLIYEKYYNQNPGDLLVLHTCDNPGCINPDHLYLGTQADNVRDYQTRGLSLWTSSNPSKKKKRVCGARKAKIHEKISIKSMD